MAIFPCDTLAPANDPAPGAARAQRHDGWTPERQRTFLTALADGHSVESACAMVGLSVASAYALRRRPAGAAFALAWRAACLLARDALADLLMRRVIDGQTDTYTKADGEIVKRHRYDNRLAAAMLTRLDRLADPRTATPSSASPSNALPVAGQQPADAARYVAADWDRFVDLVDQEDAAAAADRFVAAAAEKHAAPGGAEAAKDKPELPQLPPASKARKALATPPAKRPVRFSNALDQWLTRFPPPPGFDGLELGRFGDLNYERGLSAREVAVQQQGLAAGMAEIIAQGSTERDAWFGFVPDPALTGCRSADGAGEEPLPVA